MYIFEANGTHISDVMPVQTQDAIDDEIVQETVDISCDKSSSIFSSYILYCVFGFFLLWHALRSTRSSAVNDGGTVCRLMPNWCFHFHLKSR